MFSVSPPVGKLSRRSKVGRDDYRPEKVDFNLKAGIWTLSPLVKRYDFVEILENGDKIGLVRCIHCSVTCSKNSFKKIKTHYFREHDQGGERPPQDENEEDADETDGQLESLSIESILSRLTAGLPNVDLAELANELREQEREESRDESREVTPPPPAAPPVVVEQKKKAKSPSPVSCPPPRAPTPPAPVATASAAPAPTVEEETLGMMVNSTFRTISKQNRRLAIEFKCSLMKIMSEYEMRMLDGERK